MQAADLTLLTAAAKTAGDIAQRYFKRNPDTWEKDHGAGPVTQADLEIDAYLRATLCAARPDYGWLSEETTDTPERLTRDACFVVDPLDGTRSFIAGETAWAHSMAVVRGGQVQVGVIYLPMMDLMFWATKGHGAFCNGTQIQVSTQSTLHGASVLAARPAQSSEHWVNGVVPPFERHYRPSLAYRLALIAQGRFDAMLTLRDSWEWDIAAGILMIQEAGGSATDRNGNLIVFNSPNAKSAGVIAATPMVHQGLLDALT